MLAVATTRTEPRQEQQQSTAQSTINVLDDGSLHLLPEVVRQLVARVDGWTKKIKLTTTTQGQQQRAVALDPLPLVSAATYELNTTATADWLRSLLLMSAPPPSLSSSSEPKINGQQEQRPLPQRVELYIGFEAFYDVHFDALADMVLRSSGGQKMVFSPLVKSSLKYLQNKARYEAMECAPADDDENDNDAAPVIVHLGSSHAMDRLLFQEDADGRLQRAWTAGRLILLSPELFVAGHVLYRAGLFRMMQQLVTMEGKQAEEQKEMDASKFSMIQSRPASPPSMQWRRTQPCDYTLLDEEIATAQRSVEDSTTMEQVFTELYRLVTMYVERGQLNSPCYWDSGWESFHLYKSVSQALAKDHVRVPWTRVGLINARNAAIGDSLHAFYATTPDAFPLVVCGDTAALLAGGISMINIHTKQRFGVVIIPNNRGMAIEDVISKRSVDGHQYQYDYVKLERKRDIFTLAQLKEAVVQDVLAQLRDHLWGVSAHRAEAIVLNIDVQSLRRENAEKAPTDAVLLGRSFLDQDFGERFRQLQRPRRTLEAIVNVLYAELNNHHSGYGGTGAASATNGTASDSSSASARGTMLLPVKIQGCSAIEFMEIVSQLSITMRDKLKFLPTPTDLLATRTLLPSLVEARSRPADHVVESNFTNSNGNFSVFVSNSIFGLDGLNNLISTHLEYGTGTLVHLAYDAADTVTHYSLIGQVHRSFGIRPSTLLPQLYRIHQAYEGQIVLVRMKGDDDSGTEEAVVTSAAKVQAALRDPAVKAILVDMGAPNLTSGLTTTD
jgi:hypothetical protein